MLSGTVAQADDGKVSEKMNLETREKFFSYLIYLVLIKREEYLIAFI